MLSFRRWILIVIFFGPTLLFCLAFEQVHAYIYGTDKTPPELTNREIVGEIRGD